MRGTWRCHTSACTSRPRAWLPPTLRQRALWHAVLRRSRGSPACPCAVCAVAFGVLADARAGKGVQCGHLELEHGECNEHEFGTLLAVAIHAGALPLSQATLAHCPASARAAASLPCRRSPAVRACALPECFGAWVRCVCVTRASACTSRPRACLPPMLPQCALWHAVLWRSRGSPACTVCGVPCFGVLTDVPDVIGIQRRHLELEHSERHKHGKRTCHRDPCWLIAPQSGYLHTALHRLVPRHAGVCLPVCACACACACAGMVRRMGAAAHGCAACAAHGASAPRRRAWLPSTLSQRALWHAMRSLARSAVAFAWIAGNVSCSVWCAPRCWLLHCCLFGWLADVQLG